MKKVSVLACILGMVFIVVPMANAEEKHQIPDAPQEYLDMENPVDIDDVDDRFLRKLGKRYKRKCAKCHGAEGDGQGTAIAEMEIKPTAFNTTGYLESRKDGQLFWILLEGSEGTEMKSFGPDSEAGFSEEKLWELVTYIRAKFTPE